MLDQLRLCALFEIARNGSQWSGAVCGVYSLEVSYSGCAQGPGPQAGSVSSQPANTDLLVFLQLLGQSCLHLLRKLQARADKVKDVRRACTVIQTLVPGRRSSGEIPLSVFLALRWQ